MTRHAASLPDLEILTPEGMSAGHGLPHDWGLDDVDRGLPLTQLSPSSLRLAAILAVATAVVAVGFALHFRNTDHKLRYALADMQRTLPNLGRLAYEGGGSFIVPSPAGTQVTMTVAFVKAPGASVESVWVSARTAGLDPKEQLVVRTCDGLPVGVIDQGEDESGGTVFNGVNLGAPPLQPYDVVLQLRPSTWTTGWLDAVGGVSIGPGTTIVPVGLDVTGCPSPTG
jgi:hypothetical protein